MGKFRTHKEDEEREENEECFYEVIDPCIFTISQALHLFDSTERNTQAITETIRCMETQLRYISTSNSRPECEVSDSIAKALDTLTHIKTLWKTSVPSLYNRRSTTPINLRVIHTNIDLIKKLLQDLNHGLLTIIEPTPDQETKEEPHEYSIFSGPGPR